MPIQELEQRIQAEFDDNPVLDDCRNSESNEDNEPKDVSIDELKGSDDDIPAYKLRVNNYGKDERPEYNTFSVKESFSQSLLEQLGFRNLNEHKMLIGRYIICSLDEGGYLRRDLDSIVDDLAFRENVETDYEEVLEMLKLVQSLDPPGVGARNLRECLLLQLNAMQQSPDVINAKLILSDYFHEFTSKHFQKIINKMGISEQEMKAAINRIVKLNPSPGGQIDDSYTDQAQQIIPDFHLEYEDGKLNLTMPRFNIPEIRVNRRYAQMLEQSKGCLLYTSPSPRDS